MAIDREELKKLGLEEETITKVLNLHHAELKPFKEKAEQYDSEKERADKLKADYDAQTKKITDLEKLSGNATGLQAEIEKLKEEAKKKEEEHTKAINDMKAKADETDFNRILDNVLSGAKAKRKSAVIAELKLDDLRASKNREADIKKAVEELVSNEETAFLFESAEAKPTGSKVNFPGGTGSSGNDAAVVQARAIMGLPTNNNKE